MRLCGCNHKEKLGCSNGILMEYQIRISRSGERQKICRIVAMKIRGNILCSGELGGLCCWWNAYHQNLDRIDEMKHLPGAWIWKTFRYCIIHSEATWGLLLCLVTAAENVSPLACLPLARPFFYAPTTSKRLLRRLVMFLLLHWQQATQSVWTWHDYPWKSCTAVIHDMITCDLACPWHDYCIICS